MKRRKVDIAYDFYSPGGPTSFYYRDLADDLDLIGHKEFAPGPGNQTPWLTLHRDMSQDPRFVRARDRSGLFCLRKHLDLLDEESRKPFCDFAVELVEV